MKLSHKALMLAITLAATSAVQAVMITGNIAFTGRVGLYDTSSAIATMANADGASSWNSFLNPGFVTVEDADGAFAGSEGSKADIVKPWAFNSGYVDNFWTVGVFTFDLLYSSISSQSAAGIIVVGKGILSAPGYENTPADWFFSTQGTANSNGRFSFSSSTSATPVPPSVPDSGTTIALLGISLTFFGLARRRVR